MICIYTKIEFRGISFQEKQRIILYIAAIKKIKLYVSIVGLVASQKLILLLLKFHQYSIHTI